MTFEPSNTLETPLTENINFGDSYEVFRKQFSNLYKDVARKVNNKERAFYPETEILNNQQFFTSGDPQKYRQVFRKVYEIGAIAAGVTLNTAHGLTGVTEFTRIYGTVVTSVPDYRPLPRVSTVNINQQISLDVVGANVVVINGAGGPNITSGIIVLEYLKQ